MPGLDKAAGRTTALVVLVIIAAVALRGYLPGAEPSAPREQPTSSPASLVIVVVLLIMSLVITVFAFIVRLRRRSASPAPHAYARRYGSSRPTRRALLIALAAILAVLLMLAWLTRLGPIAGEPPPVENLTDPPPEDAPPRTATPTPAPDASTPPEQGGPLFGYLALVTAAMLVLTAVAAKVAAGRNRQPPTAGIVGRQERQSVSDAAESSLARAAEVGLAEIGDVSREPREAIIACYAAMERELAQVPGAAPQDFDTPTEVLARAVEHHALQGENATRLVDLFEEARFSSHVMTEEHREVAVRELRMVLTELRSGV